MEDLMKPRDGLRESDDAVMPMKLVLQPSGMAVELTKAETVVGRHMSCDSALRRCLTSAGVIAGSFSWTAAGRSSTSTA